MASRRLMLFGLLISLARVLDYAISALLITLGLYLYFKGFEDLQMLITISSMLLVIYGIRRILDVVGRSITSKEFEELAKRETK